MQHTPEPDDADADEQQQQQQRRWALPPRFLPVPKGVPPIRKGSVTSLNKLSHDQLLQLAAKHNRQQGMPDDPFKAVLAGIPERAQLRPDSQQAVTHTLGLKGLPPHGKHAKAWRRALRQPPAGGAAAGGKAGPSGAAGGKDKRPKGAGDRARPAAAGLSAHALWQQLQPHLTPEQQRFRAALATLLGRPVNVPLLAVGAPVLDLQRLLIEVKAHGGVDKVTQTNDWAIITSWLQRDTALAPLVAAVYDCYLQPLEQLMPYGYRPAKALDLIANKTQQRAAMGARVATYEGVVFAVDRAAAALRQLARWQQEQAQQAQEQSSEQQQQHARQAGSGSGSGAASGSAAPAQGQQEKQQQGKQQQKQKKQKQKQQQQEQQQPAPPDPVRDCLQLLRRAARSPVSVTQQVLQHGLQNSQHPPSLDACIRDRKHVMLSRYRQAEQEVAKHFAALDDTLAAARASSSGGAGFSGGGGARRGRKRSAGAQAPAAAAPAAAAAAAAAATATAPASATPGPDAAGGGAEGGSQAGLQLDAARWLLLSRRAVLSGPPGCTKPALALPGSGKPPPLPLRERGGAAGEAGAGRGAKAAAAAGAGGGSTPGGVRKRRRTFLGITPRCGSCDSCRNPSRNKACIVNRQRMAEGKPPILSKVELAKQEAKKAKK